MKAIFLFLFACFFSLGLMAQEDHSSIIEGPFENPQAVTETCLMCHEGADTQLMQTRHWNWLGNEITKADGSTFRFGKQNSINNFCISVPSNWPRCTSCHISYGWKDASFDLTDGKNIDCLICHDQTGTYKKTPTGAGMPDPGVDLVVVAKSVGKTGIKNCSVCHFNGGGGTGVKHGDMDGSMVNPGPDLDVHMGLHGFTCAKCHAGENHTILGAGHGSMAAGDNHISCSNCHKENIHKNKVLNNHIASVACETCHIPTFARQEPTKIWWDWSMAGQDRTDVPDEYGMQTYDKKKGEFRWAKNVIPEYRWYNGKAEYYHFGDRIDPGKVVRLNILSGDIKDVNAKISPFKLMKGKQIYDSENNYLIVPKLFGSDGYWSTYDWNTASKLGMESIELAYSGKFGFVETEMYWPINHMVAPAKYALKCTACHTQGKNRLLDWEALGYSGDPMSKGGRVK